MFVVPVKAQTNPTCHWIYSESNDTEACQRRFKTDSTNWEPSQNCTANTKSQYDNTCCCPVQTSPKYLIIGSLVVVFGLITTYFFVTRNSSIS